MRSAARSGAGIDPDDLTTRARIRDAAIARFGREGFGASVRAIAADAGVSPGLVIHHFGSKDGLRLASDEYVLRVVREAKTQSIITGRPADLVAQLVAVADYAWVAAYLVQALLAGGELAQTLLDQAIADAEAYLAEGVEAGRLRPSRDPAARARFMAYAGAGAFLLYVRQHAPPDGDLGALLSHYAQEMTAPALELYTEGLFTDSSLLDVVLAHTQGDAGRAKPT
jgi:TetR/AcrR family transcriptional regulator, regulator of cefoperazone and chloramphenicol sensitivity